MGTPRLDRLDKNYFINGNFDYWQRNITFALTAATYTSDRWLATYGTGAVTISRSSDVPSSSSQYSISMVANATIANPRVMQRIENIFLTGKAGATFTLKGKMKVTDATNFPLRISISTPTSANAFGTLTTEVETTVIPTQNSWVDINYKFTMPVNSVNGLQVQFMREHTASTATTTLLSQLMLLEGDLTATEVKYTYAARNIVNEARLVKRYYEKGWPMDIVSAVTTTPPVVFASVNANPGGTRMSFLFQEMKRGVPVVTIISDITGASNQMRNASGGSDLSAAAASVGVYGASAVNGVTGVAGNIYTFTYTADAEI